MKSDSLLLSSGVFHLFLPTLLGLPKMTFAQVVLSLSLLSVVLSASAANCNTDQPRKAGDPSAQQISDALPGPNDSLIDSVCKGGFPPGSDTVSTFNTGSL